MSLRKGQKLCNWILRQGFDNETVHQKLFYMTDEEFDEALNEDYKGDRLRETRRKSKEEDIRMGNHLKYYR